MTITKLHPYQEEAVNTISEKFYQYITNPPLTGTEKSPHLIPFIFSLKSITGSGKTAMLAALTSKLGENLYYPVILWMSQSKIIVEQTLTNLSAGGKYNPLVNQSEVYSINELINGLTTPLLNSSNSLIYLTTTGIFNIQTKEGRLIYQPQTDQTNTSIWELLINRPLHEKKRGLIIIYDEGQHLTEQQINRLLELAPNALILASGTPSHSRHLVKEIQKADWKVEDLVFAVPNSKVVATGLIKNKLRVIGYESPREEILNSLIVDWEKLNKLALLKGLKGLKVIYICKTNVLEKEKFEKDNSSLPFEQRKASTILIWRHLVEHCKINPKKIAVCANLELKRDFPPPDDFILFDGQSGQDYQKFLQGNYQHIIFNKSLLEGWDDNLVSYVYIDRSIGSDIQAQQLIGRALRTPQGKHYRGQYKDLNTAYFYIKAASNQVFSEIVSKINKELENISDLIKLDVPTKLEKKKLTPVLVQKERYLPQIAIINQEETELAIREILIRKVKDYSRVDPREIEPEDKRAIMDYHIGKNTPLKVIWEKFSFGNKVSVRNVLRRNIMSRNSRALDLTDLSNLEYKDKLDFQIGRNSQAEQELKETAREIVDTYLEVIQLITRADDPIEVPDMNVNLSGEHYQFENSLHKYYSNLNPVELECVQMIDELGYDWVRNPVFIGFGIPLLSQGFTKKFYPDFLIWIDDETLLGVETTGKELLKDKLDRKLFSIASFEKEKVSVGGVVPPSKVRVGVIATTDVFGKYRVYQIGENNELLSSEVMEMRECLGVILGDSE